MFLFLPRSLCALKRIAARAEHSKFATTGIRLEYQPGLYRAEATDGRRAIIVQGPLGDDAPLARLQGPARRCLRGHHPAQGPGAGVQGG